MDGQFSKRKFCLLISFFIVHFLIFLGSLSFQEISGDLFVYFSHAQAVFERKKPYLDFNAYPPFSILFFLLPRFFTSNFSLYSLLFGTEIFLINLLSLYCLFQLSEKMKMNSFFVLGLYTLGIFFLFPLLTNRYDLIPATLTLLAFYFFLLQKREVALIFLILGGFTKLYPFFLIPPLLIFYYLDKDYKALIKFGGIFGIFLILFLVIFTPKSFFSIVINQLKRPLQIETPLASFLLLGNSFGVLPLEKEISSSINIRSSLTDFLSKYSFLLVLFGTVLIYFVYFKNLKKFLLTRGEGSFLSFPFANYFLATILIPILLGPVFSPQFLFWLCPFVPFIQGKQRSFSILAFLFSCFLTTYIYPFNYLALWNNDLTIIFFLLIRNLLLVLIIPLLLTSNFN